MLETPSHAAVATAVALARARGLAPFAGLINAVLRRVRALWLLKHAVYKMENA